VIKIAGSRMTNRDGLFTSFPCPEPHVVHGFLSLIFPIASLAAWRMFFSLSLSNMVIAQKTKGD
jgi:hypothetical protein